MFVRVEGSNDKCSSIGVVDYNTSALGLGQVLEGSVSEHQVGVGLDVVCLSEFECRSADNMTSRVVLQRG
jgi:hypothetical protein